MMPVLESIKNEAPDLGNRAEQMSTKLSQVKAKVAEKFSQNKIGQHFRNFFSKIVAKDISKIIITSLALNTLIPAMPTMAQDPVPLSQQSKIEHHLPNAIPERSTLTSEELHGNNFSRQQAAHKFRLQQLLHKAQQKPDAKPDAKPEQISQLSPENLDQAKSVLISQINAAIEHSGNYKSNPIDSFIIEQRNKELSNLSSKIKQAETPAKLIALIKELKK